MNNNKRIQSCYIGREIGQTYGMGMTRLKIDLNS